MVRILIVEDEIPTANELKEIVEQIHPDAIVTGIIRSVKEGIQWFTENQMPDIILSDIELLDSLSFDIFKEVPVSAPVIFFTAYNQYALRAFEANGIDYLLKPVDKERLIKSFEKLEKLRHSLAGGTSDYRSRFGAMLDLMPAPKTKSSIFVYWKEQVIPVAISSICLIQTDNGVTYLITSDRRFVTARTLNSLIPELPQEDFFRINRQFIVSRNAILKVQQIGGRKLRIMLSVETTVAPVVSKERASAFMKWLKD